MATLLQRINRRRHRNTSGLPDLTIKKVIGLPSCIEGDYLALLFTDGTFIIFEPTASELRVCHRDIQEDLAGELGLLTGKQVQQIRERRHQSDLRRLRQEKLEEDKRQLERLKRIYPSKFR